MKTEQQLCEEILTIFLISNYQIIRVVNRAKDQLF